MNLPRTMPSANTLSDPKDEEVRHVQEEKDDLEDLFRTIIQTPETTEKNELNQTIKPGILETTNSESTEEEELKIVTSEEETQLDGYKKWETRKKFKKQPKNKNSQTTLRQRFENRKFTEAEFFGRVSSPNKRDREAERSPQDDKHQKKDKKT